MDAKQWQRVFLLILAITYPLLPACVATDAMPGVKMYTPLPPYPSTALGYREQGSGMVRVTFDGSGKAVKAEMVRSTGYDDLDENVVNFARKHWTAPPNVTINFPVDYRITNRHHDTGLGARVPGQWYTPPAHYPPASVTFMESGSGAIKVTTNASGRVTHAEMTQSTGVKRLDENSIHYATGFWYGPPNSTKEMPVSYRLKTPHY